jgi:predicted nucleic acid-binding Zn ribbon protein
MARKTKRICVVCGKEFEGTAAAQTCSGACRTALARIKEAKKRPEYILMAKGKGQKIPDLNAPKRLTFAKGEKKANGSSKGLLHLIESSNLPKYEPMTTERFKEIKWTAETIDEPTLTKEQKLEKIAELEKKKKAISSRNVMGGSPKAAALQKAMEIDAIDEEIEKLKL